MNIVNIIHIADDIRNVKTISDEQRNGLHEMAFKQPEKPHKILGCFKKLEVMHIESEIKRMDELPKEKQSEIWRKLNQEDLEGIGYKMNQASA